MSNFCMNCGAHGTLEYSTSVFFEHGEYNQSSGTYEAEGDLDVLRCTACQQEQIDVSGGYGTLSRFPDDDEDPQ